MLDHLSLSLYPLLVTPHNGLETYEDRFVLAP
jgi:hypothetical protein